MGFVSNFIRFPAVECLKVGTFFETQCITGFYFCHWSPAHIMHPCSITEYMYILSMTV